MWYYCCNKMTDLCKKPFSLSYDLCNRIGSTARWMKDSIGVCVGLCTMQRLAWAGVACVCLYWARSYGALRMMIASLGGGLYQGGVLNRILPFETPQSSNMTSPQEGPSLPFKKMRSPFSNALESTERLGYEPKDENSTAVKPTAPVFMSEVDKRWLEEEESGYLIRACEDTKRYLGTLEMHLKTLERKQPCLQEKLGEKSSISDVIMKLFRWFTTSIIGSRVEAKTLVDSGNTKRAEDLLKNKIAQYREAIKAQKAEHEVARAHLINFFNCHQGFAEKNRHNKCFSKFLSS